MAGLPGSCLAMFCLPFLAALNGDEVLDPAVAIFSICIQQKSLIKLMSQIVSRNHIQAIFVSDESDCILKGQYDMPCHIILYVIPFCRYRAHETNERYLERQRRGESSAIEVLARAGANVNAKDKYGFSPLHYSALRGNHSETVELLSCGNIDIEVG